MKEPLVAIMIAAVATVALGPTTKESDRVGQIKIAGAIYDLHRGKVIPLQ